MKHKSLKEARLAAGMTQQALAETVGVSPLTVTRWESGQARPHPRTRERVCALLGPCSWPGDPVLTWKTAEGQTIRVDAAFKKVEQAFAAYLAAKGEK